MSQASGNRIKLTYGTTDAMFASQFVINTTGDDLIVNFSSGYVGGQDPEEQVLPVHTRIALTRQGAERLMAILQQALAQPTPGAPSEHRAGHSSRAALPPMPSRTPS